MFDTLDDQVKRDIERETTPKERWIRYAAVAIASILLFGGLYLGVALVD